MGGGGGGLVVLAEWFRCGGRGGRGRCLLVSRDSLHERCTLEVDCVLKFLSVSTVEICDSVARPILVFVLESVSFCTNFHAAEQGSYVAL